jgi:hypothetical protein
MKAGRQQLQRDLALQFQVLSKIDDTHAAMSDLAEHAEMAQYTSRRGLFERRFRCVANEPAELRSAFGGIPGKE